MDAPINIPWPVFPEEMVLGDLLKTSPEFQRFYHEERSKITVPLYWAHEIDLPPGIDYRSTRIEEGSHSVSVVRLRYVPVRAEDAVMIAHEIEHFVLDTEGFPLVSSSDQFETLSSALNSMVADPVVNSRLQKYGFDLLPDYNRELDDMRLQLEKRSVAPSDNLNMMNWAINYTGVMLEWELVDSRQKFDEFQAWFDARYTHVAHVSRKMLAMVKRIGNDTPEKHRRLYREIAGRYNLLKVLILPR